MQCTMYLGLVFDELSSFCTVLCLLGRFVHYFKKADSCKNFAIEECILNGNSYFYLLGQYLTICLPKIAVCLHFYVNF